MRFPSFPTILRTFSLYNLTRINNLPAAYRSIPAPFTRNTTIFRSMPTITFLGSLFGSQQKDMTDYPIKKSDDEWQAVLSKEQFRVIREKGTEAPYTGEYDKHMPSEGTYVRLCFTSVDPFSVPNHLATHEQLADIVLDLRSMPSTPIPRDP